MRSGANVIRSLQGMYSAVSDVVITKQGEWIHGGFTRSPEKVLEGTDVVFIALHGAYGEDGEVQKLIQRYNIPFTGSRAMPSAVAFNKHLTKETLKNYGIKMPEHKLVSNEEAHNLATVVAEIAERFGPNYIVKPLANGSSVGVEFVQEDDDLELVLRTALESSDKVLVEEYIRGREATCAVLEGYRDQDIYLFPAIEIIPPKECTFFTNEAKYNGKTQEICPGNFSYSERAAIADATELVHKALGLSQYSRADFIVRNGQPYFLEVNTLPGLTSESLLPKAAAAVGMSYEQLVSYLVETATS
jgi:D-alanine-D-alanine ligase